MCGIAGMIDPTGRCGVDPEVLDRMTDSLAHRGPDDRGTWIDGPAGLGHRRLSIIDLSAAGHQPLFDETGNVGIVFNGEIYNFRELMDDLRNRGYSFRSRSDTEVIVHAWREWGEGCVERLRGMFAFAIWDRSRRTLFLARDRIGIKPLYYGVLPDGRLLFGSELKALTTHPDMPRELRPDAVEDYFAYGYIPDPKCFFRHAFKVPPGHTLTVQEGSGCVPEPRQYWDLQFDETLPADMDAMSAALRDELGDAVRSHMVADVPVGAFLSGGVDSSAVVAMMAETATEPVHTTSISFGDPSFDESSYAASVARRYGTTHHVREVSPDDFGLVQRLGGIYDEPYADSSALPTYRVCEMAREHTKVVLSGDGGDETFAGYRRYRFHMGEERLRRLLPLGMRRAVFGTLSRIYPKMDWAPRPLRGKATFEALARDSIEGYFHGISICPARIAERLFTDQFRRELGGYRAIEVLRRHATNAPDDPLSKVQYLDFKTYLPGDILTKVDRASMAHSLEVRVPILDHRFLEWAGGLPASLRLQGGQGKAVFKRALEPLLDEQILYRSKMGFAVPLKSWFRGPLRSAMREALLGERLAATGWFNTDFLRHVVESHESGRSDYSALIWSLLMFEQALASAEDMPAAAGRSGERALA